MFPSETSLTIRVASRNRELDEYLEKQRIPKDLVQEITTTFNTDLQRYCYLPVEKLAETFVDEIVKTAKRTVLDYQRQESALCSASEIFYRKDDDNESEPSEIEYVEVFGSFENWPKIGQFTIEMGADRISDYLATWNYVENWLYDLDMVLAESDACSDFYIYEVKWSIPSPEYPIPQATASVFFTIEVSRVLPRDCKVGVTYQFEGSGYVHEPFKHTFQEKWLFNIVEAKLKFFQTITF